MSGPTPTPHTVAITGASGLIGTALSRALRARGDRVVHLVRRPAQPSTDVGLREVQWHPDDSRLDSSDLEGVDSVVHLAGAGIGDKRWTDDYKRTLVQSRVTGTTLLSSVLAGLDPQPRLVSGSAIGIYGDRGEDVLTEESAPGKGFIADLCIDWEGATWQAEEAGVEVAHLRTGIVLSPDGGAMARMIPIAKAGLAGPMGSGRQYWSWITLHDTVRGIVHLLDLPGITGAVNLTAPHPDRQSEVVKALGERLNRPSLVPAPTIALRLALGQMASEVLGSRRVIPTVLLDSGFEFDHPALEAAMAWLAEHD